MKILALDNATVNCGYAIYNGSKLTDSGVLTASKSKHIDERLEVLRSGILGLITAHNIEQIVFEDTMLTARGHNNLQTFKKLCWLQGMIVGICFEKKINYYIYLPSSWRSNIGFLKGHNLNRETQKKLAIDFAKKQYCKDVTDDEAEAICIGHSHIHLKF